MKDISRSLITLGKTIKENVILRKCLHCLIFKCLLVLCMCASVVPLCVYVCVVCDTCGGQRTTRLSLFSPSTPGSRNWTEITSLVWQVSLPTDHSLSCWIVFPSLLQKTSRPFICVHPRHAYCWERSEKGWIPWNYSALELLSMFDLLILD